MRFMGQLFHKADGGIDLEELTVVWWILFFYISVDELEERDCDLMFFHGLIDTTRALHYGTHHVLFMLSSTGWY